MLIINLRNIEEFIFKNKQLKLKFPEFKAYFDQWNLAQQHSSLKSIGKQAIIDLLNNLNDSHIKIMQEYFNVSVTIDKLSNRIVKNFQCDVENLETELNKLNDFAQVCAYRQGNQVYISMWR